MVTGLATHQCRNDDEEQWRQGERNAGRDENRPPQADWATLRVHSLAFSAIGWSQSMGSIQGGGGPRQTLGLDRRANSGGGGQLVKPPCGFAPGVNWQGEVLRQASGPLSSEESASIRLRRQRVLGPFP
jgi:hypothetical protein